MYGLLFLGKQKENQSTI